MLLRTSRSRAPLYLAFLATISNVLAADVLSTSGFTQCGNGTQDVSVQQFQLTFDRNTQNLDFAVAGESKVSQNVTAQINVTALGNVVYTKSFNPCEYGITQLCPIPSGPFHASGNLSVPSQYVNQIPSIAFSVPDLDGAATLQLTGNNGEVVSCLTSSIDNGKSTDQTAVSVATAAIAGAALILSGIASLSSLSGASAGANSGAAHSPNFSDIMQWFQFIAFSGMYNVNYPPVYRSFAKNFAWSTGLISWGEMQRTIDTFRSKTGGNLTNMSYEYLQNATLVYTTTSTTLQKRQLDFGFDSGGLTNSTSSTVKSSHFVTGIEAFVEALLIPSANTFMTVLLIFLMVLLAVAIVMLLFKLILELWALCGHLSQRFETIRREYWRVLATVIVRIILIVYGTWVLYCLYQFRAGDSWAADLLAGLTLAIFTGIIGVFTVRIFYLANKAKKLDGGLDELYEHEPWMKKYGFFYDQFKSYFWWFFVPIILVSIIRAFFLVFAAGNGMIQTIGILAVEGIFLVVLFWRRPYDGRGANVINAMIAVVRVLSIVCILIFVEQLGISRTTQTVTGVILIALQSTLTIILAILLLVSAIASCLHKRKPATKERPLDDDMEPLGIPTGANELGEYPTYKNGYTAAATTEQAFAENYSNHRASRVTRDPFADQNVPPVYEEYSSSYRSPRAPSATSTTQAMLQRMGSMGQDNTFHYQPIGSPPPAAGSHRSAPSI